MGGGQNQTGGALLGYINQLMYQKMRQQSAMSPEDYKAMQLQQSKVPYSIVRNVNPVSGMPMGAPGVTAGE